MILYKKQRNTRKENKMIIKNINIHNVYDIVTEGTDTFEIVNIDAYAMEWTLEKLAKDGKGGLVKTGQFITENGCGRYADADIAW